MKKYKKYRLLFFFNFVTIICFLITLFYFSVNKYNKYIKLNYIYALNDEIKLIVGDKELKIIEKNKYIYLNSKKYPLEIVSITRNIYKNNNKYYNELILKIKDVKLNNNPSISILSNKKSYITMFKSCWKEE